MSLTPSIFTNEFESFMRRYISLDDSFQPIYEGNSIVPSYGDYPSKFASAYETYSLSGVVLGAVHGAQQPSILESFLRSWNSNSRSSVTEFATALASYWSTVLVVPGSPAHGGVSVVSVTNDSTSHISEFESAILATITTSFYRPIFINLINNIESIALPSVTWYVTELVDQGGSLVPVTFTEKVF